MTGAEPAFVLSSPAGALVADTALTSFAETDAARAALRSGDAPIVVGALPFDPDCAAALIIPQDLRCCAALPRWPDGPLPAVRLTAAIPDRAQHLARIGRVLDELADGALEKVVLARALRLAADQPLDARVLLRRLVDADPAGYGYLVDLTAAGGRHSGAALVGASPELLVARDGAQVTCRPFAGSAPRSADPAVDAANGAALAESGKDRHEHRLVIDQLRAALAPLCADVRVAAEPQLSRTATMWHLSTSISGRIRKTATTALDLAVAVHPTAAVGGVPRQPAIDVIRTLEDDRGFYAGAVGWCDAVGNGRWVVSIRCAQLSADRRSVLAHAGGGIVAESDPDDEFAETTAKFTAIMSALGVAPPSAPRSD